MTRRFSWHAHLFSLPFVAFLTSRVFLAAYAAPESDVLGIYYEPVARPFWVDGALPYLSTGFPYPPVALVPVLLPGLWSTAFEGYHAAFQAQMVAVDVLTCVLMVRLLAHVLGAGDDRVAVAVWMYTALGFGVAVVLYDRLDIVVAFAGMVVANLYKSAEPQRWRYWIAIGLGGAYKIAPIFWLPFAAAHGAWRRSTGRWRWLITGVCSAALIVGAGAVGANHTDTSVADHVLRPIEIESTWATPFLLTRWLGLTPYVDVRSFFGSTNLVGLPELYVTLSRYTGFALLGIFYLVWMRRARAADGAARPLEHAHFLLAVVLILLATQRVLSPQYFLWLLPGLAVSVALGSGVERALVAAASLAMFALTFAVFPLGFGSVRAFHALGVLTLTARNGLLLGLAVWAARSATRRVSTFPATAPSPSRSSTRPETPSPPTARPRPGSA